jgi:hypothetical protein
VQGDSGSQSNRCAVSAHAVRISAVVTVEIALTVQCMMVPKAKQACHGYVVCINHGYLQPNRIFSILTTLATHSIWAESGGEECAYVIVLYNLTLNSDVLSTYSAICDTC